MFTTINQRIKAVLDTVYGGNVTAMAKGTVAPPVGAWIETMPSI